MSVISFPRHTLEPSILAHIATLLYAIEEDQDSYDEFDRGFLQGLVEVCFRNAIPLDYPGRPEDGLSSEHVKLLLKLGINLEPEN